MFNLWPPGWGQFWPQGHQMNKLGRGPLGDATYKISKLCTFQFQRRWFLKFSFFVPIFQTCDPRGMGQFWPKGHHMKNLGRGPLGEATYQYQSSAPASLREEYFFKVFLLCCYVSNLWPPGRGQFWPQWHHMKKLGRSPLGDTTYQISKLCTFWFQRRKFLKFSFFVPVFQTCDPRGGASFDPKDIIWTNLVEVHEEKLHTKYQSYTPSSFREEDFQRLRFFVFGFFFLLLLLPWQPELYVELNSLNNFGRASPKEHSCQVSWRLAQ